MCDFLNVTVLRVTPNEWVTPERQPDLDLIEFKHFKSYLLGVLLNESVKTFFEKRILEFHFCDFSLTRDI